MSEASGRAVTAQMERLEAWFRAHAPALLGEGGRRPLFHPPVRAGDLAALEARLGPLPAGLRALLDRHDGCRHSVHPLVEEKTGTTWRLLPAAEILRGWEAATRAAEAAQGVPIRTVGPVEAVWWSPRWIPIAGDGTGDRLCVDVRPAPGGHEGQIVHHLHDDDLRVVLHPSLAAWLGACADAYEAGRYVVDDGSIVRS